MSSDKQELKEAVKLYKMAGIAIVLIVIVGIAVSIFLKPSAPETAAKPAAPEPVPTPIETPVQETPPAEPVSAPVVNQTLPETTPANATPPAGNVTPPAQTTVPAPKLTWNGIKIDFPDSINNVTAGKNSFNSITITEADNTPVTNGEQFIVEITLEDHGKIAQLVPTYENKKWLIMLILNNKATYPLTVSIKCAKLTNGYCARFYGEGSAEKTATVTVV